MTVSNTNTFNQVRNQIIGLALARLGIKTFSRDLSPQDITQGSTVLNSMVKAWKNQGRYLWKIAEGSLFLANGQNTYIINGSTANATESYSETTTTADAILGATTVTVTSTTGFVIGYNIGVEQDDNTILWTTITNIVGLIITLNTALTAAATSGNAVYSYQTKINRPESVDSARLKRDENNEIPCVMLARDTYFNIPVKRTVGAPNQVYYDKQLTYGTIYVWPTPNSVQQILKFTFQKMFYDFDTPTNDPDFPSEWIKSLYLGLAVDLAGFYGKNDPNFIANLKLEFQIAFDEAQGYGSSEFTSFYVQPATNININTYR